MFTGFSDATIDFLWELRFHNERPWFLEHKQVFLDTLDRPMKALAAEVTAALEQAYPQRKWYLHVARIYRDARITNIYEGTSQLQVVAAIRHVTTGTYLAQIKEYEAQTYEQKHLHEKLVALREEYEQSVQKVVSAENNEFIDFHARRMVEMAAHNIISYLLMRQAGEVEDYRNSAELYVKYAEAQNSAAARYIESSTLADLDLISAVKEEEL